MKVNALDHVGIFGSLGSRDYSFSWLCYISSAVIQPGNTISHLRDGCFGGHALFTFSSHGGDFAVPSRTISQEAGNFITATKRLLTARSRNITH